MPSTKRPSNSYKHLFSTGKIGDLELKNRISFAPMGVGALYNQTGGLTPRGIDYFVERARGGVGMVRMGHTRSTRNFEQIPGVVSKHAYADDKIQVSWMSELAEKIHDYDAKASLQLTAGVGRIAGYDLQTGKEAIGPSENNCYWYPHSKTRTLSLDEIKELVDSFKKSASLVKLAGLDALELNAHEGYLIDQFLTPIWNKRDDRYGGKLENRFRFLEEIIQAIKSGSNDSLPIIVRFGLTHHFPDGRAEDEGLEIARLLEKVGVAAVEIDAGCYETWYYPHPPTTLPQGLFVNLAAKVKAEVNIPVIAVGKLGNPDLAERVLEENKADFIALARPLLADPEWANKVKESRTEDICPCIGCHEGCLKRIFQHKYISCAVNPSAGIEKEFMIRKAESKKKVLVVGGGVGGMEAARVSALKGHKVHLWEKENELGGNFRPSEIPEFKIEYKYLIDYYSTQMQKLDVIVELNKNASPELIDKLDPDVVFIATGAKISTEMIKGIERPAKVFFPQDVFNKEHEIGENVTIIGGGLVGCELALVLKKLGKNIRILEKSEDILSDMFYVNKMHFKNLIDSAGIEICTSTLVDEIIDEKTIKARCNNNEQNYSYDSVIIATGYKENKELLESLEDTPYDVYGIGDCIHPGKVIDAIWKGFRTARLELI